MVSNFVQGMRLKSAALALFAGLALAGCGGGNSDAGLTNDPIVLDVAIAYGASTPANSVTTTTPATITATVRDSAGRGVNNAVVTFTSAAGLTYTAANGTTGPSNASATTNSAGVASINVLADGTVNGGITVTVATRVGTKSASNIIGVSAAVP
jgi:hypothetical protein